MSMIKPLLQISTTPIRFEMEIQWARLEPKLDIQPRAKVKTDYPKVNVSTQNAAVQIDTYQARRSLGLNNGFDFNMMHRDKSMEKIGQLTREHVGIGDALTRIDRGVTISQVYKQRIIEKKQPKLYPAFLPSTGAELSWIPHQISAQHHEGKLDFKWDEMRNTMNYVPGSVRISILQQPRVEIEYMGGHRYIPPSADPNYEEPVRHIW